ncbi:MAG TPA: DeoR/GlpR family DNA-binding transcription regulator [Sphaerochaeta sp.]|jgi:DeoR family fructose operon transcriptional repressor|nr:DeoR/GlpR family DNA-binding transcription regulator [Spirochaetota bacterium]NLL24985.1 DeoR/GlpR transcriptional regulator [Spirochaetales bacterium]TAH56587.1 MAG: DeoR/GlpR transcriptional regulator [Sphaerochaeta sp.]HOR79579.1 DeoR/GlpR family DNA-binding transcription regulator [Sphaerochaeta sp.]HPK64635.1 DeoR/GlpR family DNA-binding transcription regulator [Sphaerochaeta sp.]
MNSTLRKREILALLEEHGSVQVGDLANRMGVSKVTIRNDLDELATLGSLVRTHGGAIIAENKGSSRYISNTIHEFRKEKEAIASLAVTFVKDGQSIIIDNGSTTMHIASHLAGRHVTVVTSSLLVMKELMEVESVDLMMAGGILRRPAMGLMGAFSKDFYRQIHADWYFMGGSGYLSEQGVFCTNLIEADSKRSMIESAAKVVFLADSSKMEHPSLAKVCDWSVVDYMITDRIDAEVRSVIESHGVKVVVVGEPK